MAKNKPNQKQLYVAADTEAQMAFNDEKVNYRINVELKGQRAIIKHRLKYNENNVELKAKDKAIDRKIKRLTPKLCNQLNPYLIGWAPVNHQSMRYYDSDVKQYGVTEAQDVWVERNVRFTFEPEVEKSPWEWFLDDLVKHYQKQIKTGATSRLIIYFHNLDYDGQQFLQLAMDQKLHYPILIDNVLHNGTLYSIEFRYRDCVMELRDSMKIYNQALSKLGANVGWSKKTSMATYGWFDLKKDQERIKNEIYYFKYDIAVLAAIMREHFKKIPGKARLTAAGYAEADLKRQVKADDKKRSHKYFDQIFKPAFFPDQEEFIRSTYYGGFVYANRDLLNMKLTNGIVADVNSLYPSVMLNRDYPVWSSLRKISIEEFNKLDLHDYHTFVLARVRVTKLHIKPGAVPCVPKKTGFGVSQEIYELSDLTNPVLNLTNLDLYWITEFYDFEYQVIFAVAATRYMERPFRSFVLKHKREKEKAVENHNKVDKMIAKLHLNSVYGKFAQRQITTKTELLRNSDGTIGFTEVDDPNADTKPHNILIATFVTAFARDVLLDMIYQVIHNPLTEFWYCDTDAVHFGYNGSLSIIKDAEQIFQEAGFPYSPSVFGKWKPEQIMSKAIYLGSKRYWEQDVELEHEFAAKCRKQGRPYTTMDKVKAGAVIKGAGIQAKGKNFLVERGFDRFCYGEGKPLIVPFTVSKRCFGGIKIFDSIKLIEPSPTAWKFLKNKNLL